MTIQAGDWFDLIDEILKILIQPAILITLVVGLRTINRKQDIQHGAVNSRLTELMRAEKDKISALMEIARLKFGDEEYHRGLRERKAGAQSDS